MGKNTKVRSRVTKATQHKSILDLDGADLENALNEISNAYQNNQGSIWTPKMEKILKHLHGKVPVRKITDVLGVSPGAVKYKIDMLHQSGALGAGLNRAKYHKGGDSK